MSRYDTRRNRYRRQQEPQRGSSTPNLPAVLPTPPEIKEPRRRPPRVEIYEPNADHDWRDRGAARRLRRGFEVGQVVIEAAVDYTAAKAKLTEAYGGLVLAEERLEYIGEKIAVERADTQITLTKRQRVLLEAEAELSRTVAHHERDDALDHIQFEVALAEQENKLRVLRAQLSSADKVAAKRAEAEMARLDNLAARERVGTARSRKEMTDLGQPPEPIETNEGVPDFIKSHLGTELRINKAKNWVEQAVADIEARARAEGRTELNPEEAERKDALLNSLRAGENELRRRRASDL